LQCTARNARLSRTSDYEGQHLEVSAIPSPASLGPSTAAVEARTSDGRRRVRILATLRAVPGGEPLLATAPNPGEPIERRLRLQARAGEPFVLERWVLVRAAEDAADEDEANEHAAEEHVAGQAAAEEGCDDDAMAVLATLDAAHFLAAQREA